jgi:hypothetical protein
MALQWPNGLGAPWCYCLLPEDEGPQGWYIARDTGYNGAR